MRTTLPSLSFLALSLVWGGTAAAKITVLELDKKPFESTVTVIAPHWGFNDAEKKVYLKWLGDKVAHSYSTKARFKAAIRAAANPLPDPCAEQLRLAARMDSGYICGVTANACHQTSTRMAPIFLGPPTEKLLKGRTHIDSFDTLSKDICGPDFASQKSCHPRKSAVYQLFTNDDDTESGHSFFVACLADKGCVVLQGVAGAYRLQDWIGVSESANEMRATPGGVMGTLAPGASERYGFMQLLDGGLLHEWLSAVGEMAKGEGTMRSLLAFWPCDGGTTNDCKRLFGTDGKVAELSEAKDSPWSKAWTRAAMGRVVGDRYDWDGTCRNLEDVRQYGASYPSIYCRDDSEIKAIVPKKAFPERRAVCVMGLGMASASGGGKPARPGYLPEDQEGFECNPRDPDGGGGGSRAKFSKDDIILNNKARNSSTVRVALSVLNIQTDKPIKSIACKLFNPAGQAYPDKAKNTRGIETPTTSSVREGKIKLSAPSAVLHVEINGPYVDGLDAGGEVECQVTR